MIKTFRLHVNHLIGHHGTGKTTAAATILANFVTHNPNERAMWVGHEPNIQYVKTILMKLIPDAIWRGNQATLKNGSQIYFVQPNTLTHGMGGFKLGVLDGPEYFHDLDEVYDTLAPSFDPESIVWEVRDTNEDPL